MDSLRKRGRRLKNKLLELSGGSKNKSSVSLPALPDISTPQSSVRQVLFTATEAPAGNQPAILPGSIPAVGLFPASNLNANAASTISLPTQLVSRTQLAVADVATATAASLPAEAEELKKGRSVKSVAWAGAKTLLGLLESSADAFGPLKSAIGGLNRCIDIFEKASKGRKDYEELGEKLHGLLTDLLQFKDNLGGPVINASVKNLCSGIEAELKLVEQKEDRNKAERLAEAMEDSGEILEFYRRIQEHLERLKLNANVNTWEIVDHEAAESRLRQLCPTMASVYNSGVSHNVKRGPCTEGTRVHELEKLKDWAHKSLNEPVYWLNGMAGTGKTTISYSLCTELDDTNKLAASFFCSRSRPECRDVKLIIPTIAYQLARFSHPFRHALSSALKQDPDAHARTLEIQFQKLVIGPLKEAHDALPSDFVVVIDALDECEDDDSIGKILDLLVSDSPTSKLPVRFLISSRPEPEIYDRMVERVKENPHARLTLHELDSSIVKNDIERYLRLELRNVLLTDLQFNSLVERCGLLFIYASTVARYIIQGHKMKNYKAVSAILGVAVPSNPKESTKGLDELYTTILYAAFDDAKTLQEDRERMKMILHTVVCAQEPMTVETLASLLRLDSEQVGALLGPLRSVIHVTEDTQTITTLHTSFSDFMLSIHRSGNLHYCDAIIRHNDLTLACLQQIGWNEAQFNICGLESSYVLDSDVTGPRIAERASQAISPSLGYACRYWAAHLNLGGQLAYVQAPLYDFLSARLLLWMEVLSVKNCVGMGVKAMKDVENWCQRAGATEDIIYLAHDAWRFIYAYANHPISQSTPHIYISMLPFWPDSRPITKHYATRTINMPLPQGTAVVRRQSALLATWPMGQSMFFVRFFPNGTQIIVGSRKCVYVLDAWTGQIALGPLEGHAKNINSVTISPDGLMIAIGSEDQTILVRDAATGLPVGNLLRGQESTQSSIEFSPDSTRLVSARCYTGPRIWSIQTGEYFSCAANEAIDNPVFSADGLYITANTSSDMLFWDANTGALVEEPPDKKNRYKPRTLDLQWETENSVHLFTFSPNSLYVATSSIRDDAIRIWYAETLTLAANPLEGHNWMVMSIAFSPDSTRLASCSSDGTVCIWNMQYLDQNTDTPGDHFGSITSMRFSCDGSHLVTGYASGNLCLWDSHTGGLILGPLMSQAKYILSVDISPDSSYIVSVSMDLNIRLWDVRDGKGKCTTLEDKIAAGEIGSVRFSDGLRLVFKSQDGGYKVYLLGDSLGIGDVTSNSAGECDTKDLESYKDFPQSLTDSAQRIIRFNKENRGYLKHMYNSFREPAGRHIFNLMKYSVSFSSALSRAVSGLDNGTIQLWDVQSGQPMMAVLQGHTKSVRFVQISSDGSRIMSCSEDHIIRFWTVPSKEELEKYSPENMEQTADTINDEGSSDSNSSESVRGDGSDDVDASNNNHHDTHNDGYGDIHVNDLNLPPSQAWTMQKGGWVVDPEGHHLIWIPPDLRAYLLHPHNDVLISNRGSYKLQFDGTNIGESWVKCYTPVKAEILD